MIGAEGIPQPAGQAVETVIFDFISKSSSDRMKHNTLHTAYIQSKRARTQRHQKREIV